MKFRKFDLHIHTPISQCYEPLERGVSPEQVVDAAIAAGLEAIAIADHNSAAAVDAVRAAAKTWGLYVFPAIEITTPGGHVLAIFDATTPSSVLWEVLQAVGITTECSGDPTPRAKADTEEVFRQIQRRGGIAIAAHIDRWPSGLAETQLPVEEKVRLYTSPFLNALEITAPLDKHLWNQGRMRKFSLGRACIQGSDAHAPDEVGRRPFYAKMDGISIEELRQALADHWARIRFPHELNAEF